MLRMHGDFDAIKFRNLGDSELEAYITEVLTQSQLKVLREGNDLDFSYVPLKAAASASMCFARRPASVCVSLDSTTMPTMDQLAYRRS